MKTGWMHSLAVLALAATQAWGQFDSGSDESDGALNITASTVIDLSLATTATWDTPSPVQDDVALVFVEDRDRNSCHHAGGVAVGRVDVPYAHQQVNVRNDLLACSCDGDS